MAVQKDPLILSVLHKKKGEPGYRQLQGHALRDMLIVLVTKQVSVKMVVSMPYLVMIIAVHDAVLSAPVL